jgi:hypothetical protein
MNERVLQHNSHSYLFGCISIEHTRKGTVGIWCGMEHLGGPEALAEYYFEEQEFRVSFPAILPKDYQTTPISFMLFHLTTINFCPLSTSNLSVSFVSNSRDFLLLLQAIDGRPECVIFCCCGDHLVPCRLVWQIHPCCQKHRSR